MPSASSRLQDDARSSSDPTVILSGRKAVVHIAESFAGGVSVAIQDYMRNTPERSHHLIFAQRSDAPISGSELQDFATVTPLPLGFLARIRTIRRVVSSLPDVIVHAHSSFGGAYTRLALRAKSSCPIVYTPHCYAFERRDISTLWRVAYRAVEFALSFNTSAYAACSRREETLSKWPLGRRKAVFVPNVPPRHLVPRSAFAPEDSERSLRVVGAGRFGAQKAPEFFAAAVADLRAAGHDLDALWIGGGRDDRIQGLLDQAGVRVTGWLPRESALEILVTADLYLHVARWEGFPVAVLESVALGVPTIVRAIPAFDDVALPVKVDDPTDLRLRWSELIDPAVRNRLVQESRQVLADYSDSGQARALRRIYDGVPASKKGQ
ncbi:Glycosyltransferase involved in cell wall bisynthesis [Rathayibacter oskolensis]|uniref:D-inositol 3-phosphate glycosyltransferase n=1 Tax=Rathayibacter oskolensis TaxID=1891671 RepID=A0A1X7NC33_9MICO|nr:Glycosyltransferase involved in cell wall bisynthesis [Rathayibacter oskolensis]